jgi:tRNA (cytidine/uridine-2'-O-)-methyltransferase
MENRAGGGGGPATAGPWHGGTARSGGVLLAPLRSERKPASGPSKGAAPPARKAAPAGRTTMIRLALFEPDIPQNTGTILRLCACLGVEAHLIEPAGFPVTDAAFRRAGMDYLAHVQLMRHRSWEAFDAWRRTQHLRLVLFTTQGAASYLDHVYAADAILLFGRESAGVPEAVHVAADIRLVIPIQPGLRSLNVAMACAMAVGEALRQTKQGCSA